MANQKTDKAPRAARQPRPANHKLKYCLMSILKQDEYSPDDIALMTSLFQNVTKQAA